MGAKTAHLAGVTLYIINQRGILFMDLAQFSGEMAHRGCVADPSGKRFCGTYQELPFCVTYLNGKADGYTFFSISCQFAQRVKSKFYRVVSSTIRNYASLQRTNNYNSVANVYLQAVKVNKKNEFGPAFDALIASIANTAKDFGMQVPQACPLCKQPNCDAYAYHAGVYAPVHGACVLQKSGKAIASVQKNEMNGSYGLGILGAFLGGLLGAVPTILLLVFLNVISAWLCALIPLAAYYGYKLLGGKMGKATPFVVIVMSVLIVPLVSYFSLAISGYNEYHIFITPMDFVALAITYPADLLINLGQILLFTGIGVLVVFSIIRKGNQHVWSDAAFSAATLRPMANAQSQYTQSIAAGAPMQAPPAMPAAPAAPMQEPGT